MKNPVGTGYRVPTGWPVGMGTSRTGCPVGLGDKSDWIPSLTGVQSDWIPVRLYWCIPITDVSWTLFDKDRNCFSIFAICVCKPPATGLVVFAISTCNVEDILWNFFNNIWVFNLEHAKLIGEHSNSWLYLRMESSYRRVVDQIFH